MLSLLDSYENHPALHTDHFYQDRAEGKLLRLVMKQYAKGIKISDPAMTVLNGKRPTSVHDFRRCHVLRFLSKKNDVWFPKLTGPSASWKQRPPEVQTSRPR